MSFGKSVYAVIACVALAACDPPAELPPAPTPIGEFRLAHVKVSANGTRWSDASRQIDQETVETVLTEAIRERFDRYEGNKWYHLTIAVEEVLLAPAGIPVIASMKSGMVLRAAVWDDSKGEVLTDPPKEFTVVEPISGATFIGSGLTRDEDQQILALSRHAARVIEDWLKSSEESPIELES